MKRNPIFLPNWKGSCPLQFRSRLLGRADLCSINNKFLFLLFRHGKWNPATTFSHDAAAC